MTEPPYKTDFDWSRECDYCSRVADQKGQVKEMNFDTATFVCYCDMQRNAATRDGKDDAAQYLQHIIDDLKQ